MAQRVAEELRLKTEARERKRRLEEERREEEEERRARATKAEAEANRQKSNNINTKPPRALFDPRERPTARQKAEMEREEEEAARARARARAREAAAKREAEEAAAARAAAKDEISRRKKKKRILEDGDEEGEGAEERVPSLFLRPAPAKRTAVAISPRLAPGRQQQQPQPPQQQQQAPQVRKTAATVSQLLQQRRQQMAAAAAAAAAAGGTAAAAARKKPTAAVRGGAASRGAAATAPPFSSSSSSFRGVSPFANPETHLLAANELLAEEVMDGRLWFAACADDDDDDDEEEDEKEEEGERERGNGKRGAPPSSSFSSSSSSLLPVPASFPSATAYISSFLPLLLEEARQEVRSSWVEAVAAGRSWAVRVEGVAGACPSSDDDDEEEEEQKAAAPATATAATATKLTPESPFLNNATLGVAKTATAAAATAAKPPDAPFSPPPPPPAEVRLRFAWARPPPGSLRDGDVAVVTRGLPKNRSSASLEPLDWAAGGRRRVAAAGVELEEGELAADADAAAADAAAAATATTKEQPSLPASSNSNGACPVAGIVRYSNGVVTLTTRCRCPRHKGKGREDSLPPCVAALRSLSAACSSSKQENQGHQFHLTVVGNLVTHAREVAALFSVPAMPLAPSLLSPRVAAEAARAAVGGGGGGGGGGGSNGGGGNGSNSASLRWPAEASAPAFIARLRETYDHAQLRAIEIAACHHLSASGSGGSRGGGGNENAPSSSAALPPPPPFTLVQGPPGTGKTHTVTGILNVWHLVAYQRHFAATVEALTRESSGSSSGNRNGGGGNRSGGLLFPPGLSSAIGAAATATNNFTSSFSSTSTTTSSKPRLLVCAPSNAAADELLSRVMDRGFFDGGGGTYRPDVVRVGADAAPMAARAREVWVEGVASALLDMKPAERAARLHEARVTGARERRRVAAAREALRLLSGSGSGSSSSATATAPHGGDAAASQAAAVELARAADAADKAEALVERLEVADEAARMSCGSGNGTGANASDNARRIRGAAKGRLEASLVSRAEMVFTTLSSTGRRVFQLLAAANNSGRSSSSSPPPPLFETVLIDEAAQATEPAALQALRFGARSCVLVGDPRQLPATVLSGKAARAGLSRSLFERLENGEGGEEKGGGGKAVAVSGGRGREKTTPLTGVPVSLLKVQYRMHPQIRSFPSRAFYDGALEDSESVRARPAEPWHAHDFLKPYLFFDVARGREKRGRSGGGGSGASPFFASSSLSEPLAVSSSSSPSLHNDEEAALAAALVAELRGECARLGVPFPVVGVISPYRAQAAALRSALERAGGGPGGRDWCRAVETVDGFQGKEVDVAIVSCVRTRRGGGGGGGFEGGNGSGRGGGGGGEGDEEEAAAAVARALSAALSASTFSYDAATPPPPKNNSSSSSSVGFVDDLRRLNVAVTRARKALWVLGSGEALRKGSAAWAALLADAGKRGVVVRGADASGLFPGWWGRMQEAARMQQQGRGGGGGRGRGRT